MVNDVYVKPPESFLRGYANLKKMLRRCAFKMVWLELDKTKGNNSKPTLKSISNSIPEFQYQTCLYTTIKYSYDLTLTNNRRGTVQIVCTNILFKMPNKVITCHISFGLQTVVNNHFFPEKACFAFENL